MSIDFLSVVMPAYNEQASIGRVVLEHAAMLDAMPAAVPRWEIVVVDDGSTDRTPIVLDQLRAHVPAMRTVRQQNQGICGAVTRAILEARGSHVYSTGSDGQWPASNFIRMLDALDQGADLVLGIRVNRRELYGPRRLLVSRCYNLIPPLLFGVPVHDAGSVKLGRAEAFRLPLISRSPFFEAERVIRAQRAGMKIAYAPISFTGRDGGRETGASWKNIRASLRDVVRCALAYGLRRQVDVPGELAKQVMPVPNVVEIER